METQERERAERAKAPEELKRLMTKYTKEFSELTKEVHFQKKIATMLTGDRLMVEVPVQSAGTVFVGFHLMDDVLYLQGTHPVEIRWSGRGFDVGGTVKTESEIDTLVEQYIVEFIDKVFPTMTQPAAQKVLPRVGGRSITQDMIDKMT